MPNVSYDKEGEHLKHASSESTLGPLTILDLPDLLIELFAHTQRPLLAEEEGEPGLFVRYLRRKPGRGLAIIYHVDSRTSKKKQSNDPNHAVSLTLGERALEGAQILFTGEQVEQTTLRLLPSGVLHLPEMDLAVQKFPSDAGLLALKASCDTSFQSELFVALQAAANIQLQDSQWRLLSAQAEPVRYKPGSRCVIRYRLQLEHMLSQESREFIIFGKVYADTQQAHNVQELQQQLYTEQIQKAQTPLLPRPLGLLEQLGLTLNEAIQPGEQGIEEGRWAGMRTGNKALRPQIERGRGGQIIGIEIPEEELRLTGEALARLHSSLVVPGGKGPRNGAKEAKRARERADLIATRNQAQAGRVQELVEWLALRLNDLEPESYRPAHGGFKASQLLFHSHQVFVVDFDGFCLADPALDVGYFLAYLRPSGLWYQNGGMREWFEQAAASFRSAYIQGMQAQGVDRESCENIVQRARSYEAALIFKIATRRANRLNSPRPQELTAMLDEIEACLS
jgi:Phosphotransferase enzyme family